MPVVGHHPESGVRVVVERPRAGGPPWRYEGEAVTENARFRVAATADAAGVVTIELQGEAPAGLADKVRLMVRTAWKHARENDSPPPRRLVRWRPER
jgi:hypothetical protein